MQNTVIRVKTLKKSYKNVDVLNGVDFDVLSPSMILLYNHEVVSVKVSITQVSQILYSSCTTLLNIPFFHQFR